MLQCYYASDLLDCCGMEDDTPEDEAACGDLEPEFEGADATMDDVGEVGIGPAPWAAVGELEAKVEAEDRVALPIETPRQTVNWPKFAPQNSSHPASWLMSDR
ncbi:hypothetical protein VMCG_08025 [Cytospora schulzeri]|uniref:Uncharacterized protein n=1 Tax=Cytospora schulzeri TaxID=448051 RepID=A0A423VY61_9PEZI|nr:hypothetical protein VMCG_08025 [Valsa malicola]